MVISTYCKIGSFRVKFFRFVYFYILIRKFCKILKIKIFFIGKILQGFAELVDQMSKMFYDLSAIKCEAPINRRGEGIINITSELASACTPVTSNSSFNETALIIPMSILGCLLLLCGIVFLYSKTIKNKVLIDKS